MREFNTVKPIGSIYQNSFQLSSPRAKLESEDDRLVNILAYCLNQNHFHFIAEQTVDGGLSLFMSKLGSGYTQYFNHRYSRSGSLFQGKFKYIHIGSDAYLRHLSVYVNLNDRVHQLSSWRAKSSYSQYTNTKNGEKDYIVEHSDTILSHFDGAKAYGKYAMKTLREIKKRKEEYKRIGL